jgi:hypothetical protein
VDRSPLSSRHEIGAQPAVTVSGFVSGAWPGVLALTVTVVVCATDFAAWIVPVPPPLVQPAMTVGWLMTEATEGWLLDTLMGTAFAEALDSTTSMTETCPGPMVDGASVKEVRDVGGSVPPGLSLSIEGTETRLRLLPIVASGYEISTCKFTSVGALTTAVGRSKRVCLPYCAGKNMAK